LIRRLVIGLAQHRIVRGLVINLQRGAQDIHFGGAPDVPVPGNPPQGLHVVAAASHGQMVMDIGLQQGKSI